MMTDSDIVVDCLLLLKYDVPIAFPHGSTGSRMFLVLVSNESLINQKKKKLQFSLYLEFTAENLRILQYPILTF